MISIGIWSLATAAHALAASWIGFAIARFSLAVGQSGNFPSAIKAVAEWFPKKERALAVSIFNGGSNMGTILSPLIIPGLVLMAGSWRVAFLWTVPISVIWLFLWSRNFKKPENHKRVSGKELAYINSDSDSEEKIEKLPWKAILPHRGTWAIAVGKFIADPVWWFYLFWGAKFLNEKFGVNLKEIGLPFFTIYLVSWGMGMALGWFSSKLLKGGMSINRGRKLGMLACAICAVPVALVPHTDSLWLAVSLIALAAGRTLWLVCQYIQPDVGYLPQESHSISRRIWWFCRSSRRCHCGLWRRKDPSADWHGRIYHSFPGGQLCLSDRPADHPPDRSEDQTHGVIRDSDRSSIISPFSIAARLSAARFCMIPIDLSEYHA